MRVQVSDGRRLAGVRLGWRAQCQEVNVWRIVVGAGENTSEAGNTPVDVDEEMAQIVKGQQMAGHFPDDEALERAWQVLAGELSEEDAVAQIMRKYRQE